MRCIYYSTGEEGCKYLTTLLSPEPSNIIKLWKFLLGTQPDQPSVTAITNHHTTENYMYSYSLLFYSVLSHLFYVTLPLSTVF